MNHFQMTGLKCFIVSILVELDTKRTYFFLFVSGFILHNNYPKPLIYACFYFSLLALPSFLTFPFKFKFILQEFFRTCSWTKLWYHSKCIHLSGSSLEWVQVPECGILINFSSWMGDKALSFALMSSVLARTLISDQLTSFILTSIYVGMILNTREQFSMQRDFQIFTFPHT